MTQLAGDFEDSSDSNDSKDFKDSSDIAHCPTSDPETTNTPADTKGTAVYDVCWVMPFGPFRPFRPSLRRLSLDSSDSAFAAPPTTQPIVATLPLLLKNM